ncbi:hypothetical protein AC578_4633 [Pseudocercospora eumusae]|uniref:Uncharacterized protein n=1 Tax=Pseudocercospora eumusae TaxID=321146 RepID=A0A139GZ97_9PEZI|nr:hypothetical protein AC578_4633 [Pseudocercospora eumusae]
MPILAANVTAVCWLPQCRGATLSIYRPDRILPRALNSSSRQMPLRHANAHSNTNRKLSGSIAFPTRPKWPTPSCKLSIPLSAVQWPAA